MTANGVASARELVVLRLEDGDGTVGWGEAAPFEPYDGVPLDARRSPCSSGARAGAARPRRARPRRSRALDLEARQRGPAARRAGQRRAAREHDAARRARPRRSPHGHARASARATRASRSRSACPTTSSAWPQCARRSVRGRPCVWMPTAHGRWTRPCRASRNSRPTTSSSSSSPAARPRSWPGARARVDSDRGRRVDAGSLRRSAGCRARGVRRGQHQAGGRGGFEPAREAIRASPLARRSAPSCRARSTVRGASRPRCSSRPPRTSSSHAGWRRSSSSTGRWRACSAAPRAGQLRGPRRSGLGSSSADGVTCRHRWSTKSVSSFATASGAVAAAARGRRLDDRRAAALGGRGDPLGRGRIGLVAGPGDRQHRQVELSSSLPDRLSTPWPAVRSSSARSRGLVARRRGAAPRPAAADWSANSGCRSQSPTISSMPAASIQAASSLVGLARAARRRRRRCPAVAPTVTRPR